ncbi:MAG: hypothetical protein V4582_02370 [Pseudomonadota bacterium]
MTCRLAPVLRFMLRCIPRLILCCAVAPLHAAEAERADSARELVVLHKTQTAAAKLGQPNEQHFQTLLGRALAEAMGRPVRYLSLPRNRLVGALEAGEGDILCGYIPQWLPGAIDWSRGFIPVTDVVLASPRVVAPRTLEDLRGKRIGTVLGFHYPDFESALGADFRRDDGPSESMSMKKMMAGRFEYVITTKVATDTQIRRGLLPRNVHVLVTREFRTMCAVSRRGRVTVAELDAAIDGIERNGSFEKLQSAR